MKKLNISPHILLMLLFTAAFLPLAAQHNNELYNNGTTIYNSTTIAVKGDVHMAGGTLTNNGTIKVGGNMYSSNTFQQRGAGTTRLQNDNVNVGQTQFIQGSYAVRGGQSQIGVNDGSFYNLELANDQGIVWLNGTGYVADVRNRVDFYAAGTGPVNRIITDNPSALPANGSGYDAVFGIMNANPSHAATMLNNTVDSWGNSSAVDNGYVQGKLRRAISASGGQYGYVLGLEPAGAGAQRGMQYVHLDFQPGNNYDVVSGYFETGSPNVIPGNPIECGFHVTYFGGADHGEWMFEDITTTGTGNYEIKVWPQDDNFLPAPVWFITKNDAIAGTLGDCGPSPVGLDRAGFNGFSAFGVAAGITLFPVELISLKATPIHNQYIRVDWYTGKEEGSSHFEVERSLDAQTFGFIGSVPAAGSSAIPLDYHLDDWNALPDIDYFYRLKMVDLDGKFDYTETVKARLEPGDEYFSINVYPNPVGSEDLIVDLRLKDAEEIQFSVFNAIGQNIYARKISLQGGLNQVSLPTDQLSAGTYMLRVEGKDFVAGQKILKIR
ncbi:MAG: T9SS type A sorting domain-containing protein [Bacteroidia bacterium]|nr:T9SS type A sorting domain-containing protein [Bacteroidia bacterium]